MKKFMQLRKIIHKSLLISPKKLIDFKWVYKTKCKTSGEVDHYKAILVAKDYKKKLGIDYFEEFTYIIKLNIVYMIITLVA